MRIHRFQINRIDYSKTNRGITVDSHKWTRGSEIIPVIYNMSVFDGVRDILTYTEFLDMVQTCSDSHSIIFEIDRDTAFQMKHWSYKRK